MHTPHFRMCIFFGYPMKIDLLIIFISHESQGQPIESCIIKLDSHGYETNIYNVCFGICPFADFTSRCVLELRRDDTFSA